MPLRVILLATGDFALPTFQALLRSEHHMAALVTQPDRTGRGHHQHVNPPKELAVQLGINVFQPEKANAPESLSVLRSYGADLFVVAAYGQILSAELLTIPRLGAINLHGSLLPKYRGAAPVQYAIWKGETETGVTIFQIEPKLDAGPILGVVSTPTGEKETSGQLHDRLAELAAPLTLSVVHQLETGTTTPHYQDPAKVTKAPCIQKEQGLIDWSQSAREIGWHVRAMQPWPMPYSFLHLPNRPPQRMLILDVDAADPAAIDGIGQTQPGDVRSASQQLFVRTGDGFVRVNTVQPAGKRAMSAEEFLRGTSVAGGRFGSE